MTAAKRSQHLVAVTIGSTTRADRARLAESLLAFQESLFSTSRLLLPLVRITETKRFNPGEYQIRIGSQLYPSLSSAPSADESGYHQRIVEDLANAAKDHIEELLDSNLVEHYLNTLNQIVPALVAAVRERVGIEKLTLRLQTDLKAGVSIRNMAHIMEEMLVQAVELSLAEL